MAKRRQRIEDISRPANAPPGRSPQIDDVPDMNDEAVIANPPDREHALSKKELADYFGVHWRTIENWMDWLPYVRIGHVIRFDLEQVKKVAEKRFGQNTDSASTRPGPSKSAMYRI